MISRTVIRSLMNWSPFGLVSRKHPMSQRETVSRETKRTPVTFDQAKLNQVNQLPRRLPNSLVAPESLILKDLPDDPALALCDVVKPHWFVLFACK